MPILTVIRNKTEKKIQFEGEHLLSELIGKHGMHIDSPCGGRGVCKKCTVTVNGKKELACRYTVSGDSEVILPDSGEIVSVVGASETGKATENMCLCLDIGTTTLALALVSLDEKSIVKTVTAPNPQRSFGADVISRIDYCAKNGVRELQEVLLSVLKKLQSKLFLQCGIESTEKMYVAGNTTMLHLFFGIDCSALGVSPYTPVFLNEKRASGASLGFDNIGEIISLPGISAFVGADISAGLLYAEKPKKGKYSLLLDLGTNAETVLFGEGRYLSATAAAGPCFEGANISSGMSASNGAVYEYRKGGAYSVIGDVEPEGICATGLIDIIAELVRDGTVDDSGYMDDDLVISEEVKLTPADIREFQLAKSAVRSAVECLMHRAGIGYDDIETLYVAGGFSAKMNVENAAYLGLIPSKLADRFVPVNNSSLLGTAAFACGKEGIEDIIASSEFIDLGADPEFSELFFENMAFEG
ncbi:MAG: DUF4445 domain-containing protein [Clostridia bacterium]|nr:DUF4445 domain-containing protein [Clostridia bacterium]